MNPTCDVDDNKDQANNVNIPRNEHKNPPFSIAIQITNTLVKLDWIEIDVICNNFSLLCKKGEIKLKKI